MEPITIQSAIEKPLFDPAYLNLEYVFTKISEYVIPIINFILNPHTWVVAGFISASLSLILIAIIVYSIVNLIEVQIIDKEEINHKINEALLIDKEIARNENQRWNYILTLIESPNESDWRMAILEADTFMEEVLKDKDLTGTTVSELLESAKSNGYASIQSAWDAHLVRNKIAHQGSEYPISQVEGRRVIKLFQNFFEELKVI